MVQVPRCRVQEPLLELGAVQVLWAVREDDGQRVLVKTPIGAAPDPTVLARLRYEYELARGLDVPELLTPLGLERSSTGLAVLYEGFPGAPLRTHLAAGPLGIDATLDLARGVAKGLAALHAKGVLHRNLQPGAVLFDPARGEVRLTGLGVASRVAPEARDVQGAPSLEPGALPYISPEQTGRVNRSVDHRSDLYGLGALLFEALTGRPPFPDAGQLETMHSHIAKPVPDPRVARGDVPEPLARIVETLLAKRVEDRYQSAAGLLEDLEACRRSWARGGDLARVELLHRERRQTLVLPERLYGREEELRGLHQALARASAGHAEYVLVSGYSGVGKSALVHELLESVSTHRGTFVSGKFDQFQRDLPYSALVQALTELVLQVLSADAAEVDLWRERWRLSLGPSAQVVVDLVPDLARVLGPQPPVPELSPTESQARFNLVLSRFVRSCASPERPLVLFLDDLQWADAATLQLLGRIDAEREGMHVLYIGAYRSNEVDLHHPLILTLADLEKGGARITQLELGPLGRDHLGQLVADTLQVGPEQAVELTALLLEKTGGNPFFARQFIQALAADGLLRHDGPEGRWTWDTAAIEARETSSNVVELMLRRLGDLPDGCRALLRLGACMGNRFDLGTLAELRAVPLEEAAEALWPAVSLGLVRPVGRPFRWIEAAADGAVPGGPDEGTPLQYRFQHDRVQQAADSMLTEAERVEGHVRIGDLLLAELSGSQLEERLIEIVNHLNHGRALLRTRAERDRLADLNLRAARIAAASSAYGPALSFVEAGVELLPPDPWAERYGTTHALHVIGAEAAYMVQDVARGERFGEAVLAHAATPLDSVRVYELRIGHFTTQSRMRDACESALDVLALLGVRLPRRPTMAGVLASYARLTLALRGRRPEDLLELPPLEDPEKAAAMRIMMRVTSAAYQYSLPLYGTIVLAHAGANLRHGHGVHSAYGWIGYANLRWSLGDMRGSYGYGHMALRLAERQPSRQQRAIVTFLFNNFARHWVEPQRSCFEPILEARHDLVESGDLEYFAYTLYHPVYAAFYAGVELPRIAAWFDTAVATCEKLDLDHARPMARIGAQLVANLRGLGPERARLRGEGYDAEREAQALLGAGHRSAVYYAELAAALLAYTYGEFARAEKHAAVAEGLLDNVAAMIVVPALNLVQSLSALAHARTLAGRDRRRRLRLVARNQRKLRGWARAAPGNFEHKLLLVEAERASAAGAHGRAERAYEAAVQGALAGNLPQEEALACELAGLHFLRRGMPAAAAGYLRQALSAYIAWGADGKAQALRDAHPGLLGPGPAAPAAPGPASLDLASMLEASQAISSEIVHERLVDRLVRTVVRSAGADRVVLLRLADGDLRLEADRAVGGESWYGDAPLRGGRPMLVGLVEAALRREEAVVLDDARASRHHADDPYTVASGLRSALALPLRTQGRIVGMLYAENRLTPGAFGPERLALLEVLASQAGISLSNARHFGEVMALNAAYERFVPREFLRLLSKRRITEVHLGDQVQCELSVLFVDIRSFTTITESLDPAESFAFLNRYLGAIEPVILRHGGFIDKYIGDAIMALFEGPADGALAAAIDVAREVERLNRARILPAPLRVGMGINTGRAMLGTVGGTTRMDGTVIGDAVNVAERLESRAKDLGATVLISDETLARASRPGLYTTRPLGSLHVKGKREPVAVHELLDALPPEEREAKLASRERLGEAVVLLEARRTPEARAILEPLAAAHPTDRAVRDMLERASTPAP